MPNYTNIGGKNWALYNFYLVMINNKTGEIISKIYKENLRTSFTESVSIIQIDTGRYNLNEQIRAIGIRIDYENTDYLNPKSKNYISLYTFDNQEFKLVLKNSLVNNFIGIWDGDCKGEFVDSKAFINFSKNKNNSFFDIILKTNHRKYINFWSKNDCAEKTVKQFQTSKTLKFDGKFYK